MDYLKILHENPDLADEFDSLFDFFLLDELSPRDEADGRCTFSLPGMAFARDEKRIYAYGKQLPKADLPSWELLSHWYSRDAKRVYYLNREIKGADRDSFTVCTPPDAPPLSDHLARDKEHFYQNDEMIEEPLWLERLHELKTEQ